MFSCYNIQDDDSMPTNGTDDASGGDFYQGPDESERMCNEYCEKNIFN